jgi:uncharacterized membrane protein YoaK (UPF0700 family)
LDFYNNLNTLTQEYKQPYANGPVGFRPAWMFTISDILHPGTKNIIYLDAFIAFLLGIIALRNHNPAQSSWAGIITWLLVSILFLMFISFHGDNYSQARHALIAMIPFRLILWISLLLMGDFSQTEYHLTSSTGQAERRGE